MKSFFFLFVFALFFASASAQTISAPTNLTVTAERNPAGQQYFHLTFTRCSLGPDTEAIYYIVRWHGQLSDTTDRTSFYGLESDANGGTTEYDDNNDLFNPMTKDGFSNLWYSYAVYVQKNATDSLQDSLGTATSSLSNIVSAELDSNYLFFDGVPATNVIELQVGATYTYTFQAQDKIGNSSITYSIESVTPDTDQSADTFAIVSASINPTTGLFNAVIIAAGEGTLTIKATDANGWYVTFTYNIRVSTSDDTGAATITLASSGAALPAGTIYYNKFRIFAASPSTDSINSWTTGGLNSSGAYKGAFASQFQNQTVHLRASAEGYNAAWLYPNGVIDVMSDSSYTLDLTAAATHTLSGTVTDASGSPIADAGIVLYRIADERQIAIQYAKTDANGNYSFSVPEGDSIMNTLDVLVNATASGYNATMSSDELSSLESHDSVNFVFQQSNTKTVLHIYLATTEGQSKANLIHVHSTITIYNIVDSTQDTVVATDTTSTGFAEISLPNGNYIVFAQPDTGYQSGYYSAIGYAPIWDSAQTISVPGDSAGTRSWYVILPQDSSIIMQGSGVKIDGIAKSQNTGAPLSNTHLLLYSNVSGPAGTNTPVLIHTTITDANGNFAFGKIGTGTYGILVDIVGAAPFWVKPIIISPEDTTVTIPINYVTAVKEVNIEINSLNILAQNYPNPFSSNSTIGFTVSSVGTPVSLTIYNELGETVKTLVSGMLAPGSYTAQVDGAGLLPGTYFYELRMGTTTETRAMMVIK